MTEEEAIRHVTAAVMAELWELAPDLFREDNHKDLVFGVTMQDLHAAVDEGVALAMGDVR